MANVNLVVLVGRLTRDPQAIAGRSGDTLGCNCGLAVNNRKFVDGEWIDSPCFIDLTIWNRGQSTNGSRFLDNLSKGSQVYVKGHLDLQKWNDKNTGEQRSKLVLIVDEWQYIDPKREPSAATASTNGKPKTEPVATEDDADDEPDPAPTPAKAKAKGKTKPKPEPKPEPAAVSEDEESIPF